MYHNSRKYSEDQFQPLPVGPAAYGTGLSFVALLIARVTNGEVSMPPGRLPSAGRPRTTVSAHTAAFALPAVLGNLTYMRPQALRVVSLVAVIASEQLALLGRRSTHLAVPAAGAQPASTDIGRGGRAVACTMVVRAAARAHDQIVNISEVAAHLTRHITSKV